VTEITPAKVVSGVAAAAAAVALVLWGVPYYIKHQVSTEVAAELAGAGIDTTKTDAVNNKAQLGAVLTRLDSMEQRMVERDRIFLEYLQKQADN